MSNDYNLKNTYWSNAGAQQAISEKLQALVPESGEVANADDNPALETLRIASNCYYDLYNNGLCNRAVEFREVFGFGPENDDEADDYARFNYMDAGTDYFESLDQAEVNKIERKMTRIIIAAAKEQGIEVGS